MAFPFYLQFRRDGAHALCAGVFAMLCPSPVTVSPAPLPQLTRCDLLLDDFLRRQRERLLLCSSPSWYIPVPAQITPSQRPAAHFTRQHGLMCSSCLDTGLQSMVLGQQHRHKWGPIQICWVGNSGTGTQRSVAEQKTSRWFWCRLQLLLQCIKLAAFAVMQEVLGDGEGWRAAVRGVTESDVT